MGAVETTVLCQVVGEWRAPQAPHFPKYLRRISIPQLAPLQQLLDTLVFSKNNELSSLPTKP